MAALPAVTVTATDWARALRDVLLPEDVNADALVRLNCDDVALADAARALGVPGDRAAGEFVACLRAERLIDDTRGVNALAKATLGDPPGYLLGLCCLVLAASRMADDERASMRAYYLRLAELLDVPLHDSWPPVAGVRALTHRFDDLAAWMAGVQRGRRGVLDLPRDVHPSIVGVAINQALLRAGDRVWLGAFFDRAAALIDAGWDPVHQLRRWGGRHHLTLPLQRLLDRPELHGALAGALRVARRAWDGSTVDADGRRLLAAQLALHLPPFAPFALSATVPALTGPVDVTGPDGQTIIIDQTNPAGIPVGWLDHARDGVLAAPAGEHRVRLLSGPTTLFAVTALSLQGVAVAGEEPVWALTCDSDLIGSCPVEQRYTAPLPTGWELLCDIAPDLLGEDLRAERGDTPGAGIALTGGLRLADSVYLLDHPPTVTCDLGEPAPVSINGRASGDIDAEAPLTLEAIAHTAGVHTIEIADVQVTVELAAQGPRARIGTIGVDCDPRRVHADARELPPGSAAHITGAVCVPPDPPPPAGLTVRYRSAVDVIDIDGRKRNLAPPPPAAWLSHVGLSADGPWEITDPDRIAWVCVDAPGRKQVIAYQPVDVPITDDVLDIVDWFADDARMVDRTDGRACARWQRLVDALHDDES